MSEERLTQKISSISLKDVIKKTEKQAQKIEELQIENDQLKDGRVLYSSLKELKEPVFSISKKKNFLTDYTKYKHELKVFRNEVKKYNKSFQLGFWDKRKNEFDIKPESILIEDRQIKINDTYRRIYYLSDIQSSEIMPGIFFKILNCPFPMTISIYVKETSSSAMIRAAKNTRAVYEAEENDRKSKGKGRKEEIALAIEHANEFIEKLVSGSEKAFLVSIYAAIEATSKDELLKLHSYFKNSGDESQLNFNPYTFGQDIAYSSILPLVENSAGKDKVIHTTLLTYLMPFLQKNINDPDGIFLGRNSSNGTLVLFDLFKARNANVNILGTSGSGKSVTAKLMALRLFLRKTQIIIIDPEGEYSKITKAVNGKVIKFTRRSGINPFYIGDYQKEDYKDHVQTLKGFFKFFISDKNYKQSVLDEALVEIYEAKKPSFSNLIQTLSRLKAHEMARDIKVLEDGSLSGIFNSEERIELSSENLDWITFDLSDLESDEYKKPAMYLLASIVSKLIKNADRRRMLFIDEAHILLENNDTAIFYKNLVKRARKYNAGVVSISQNIEDYLSSKTEFGKSIVTNAETTFLLKQSFVSLKDIMSSFPINENEKTLLPTLSQGEALLFREKEHMRIYILPLPAEKEYVFTNFYNG